MDFDTEKVVDGLRILLAAGGPLSSLLIAHTGLSQSDISAILQIALFIVPPVGAWAWGLYLNTPKRKAAALAAAPEHEQLAALSAVSGSVKVQLAETVPEVATVVVKDTANGVVGALAQDDAHAKVVTETQNEADAKLGTKVKV